MERFPALVIDQAEGKLQATLRELTPDALPAGDVTVRVQYSSLNYKDGLAVTGKGKVIRKFPMVPGIDLVGTVIASDSPLYQPGDAVMVNGWGLGERHPGGYSGLARVKADWLIPLPAGLTPTQAMAIGTAGFCAMLAVMALEDGGVRPGGRPVAVSGAAGGVGSVAVALLARQGFQVSAFTGRAHEREYLQGLGATEVLDRNQLTVPGAPLESERWAGAVDTVGGEPLATLLRSTAYGGVVAACGLAAGAELHTTVFPFILRGVSLAGIDTVNCPAPRRRDAWDRLALELDKGALERMTRVVPLREVPALAEEILAGRVRGRIVVDVQA